MSIFDKAPFEWGYCIICEFDVQLTKHALPSGKTERRLGKHNTRMNELGCRGAYMRGSPSARPEHENPDIEAKDRAVMAYVEKVNTWQINEGEPPYPAVAPV